MFNLLLNNYDETKRDIKTWVGGSLRSRPGTIALNHTGTTPLFMDGDQRTKWARDRARERGSYIDPERVVVCVLPHLPCPN